MNTPENPPAFQAGDKVTYCTFSRSGRSFKFPTKEGTVVWSGKAWTTIKAKNGRTVEARTGDVRLQGKTSALTEAFVAASKEESP